jgi:peptidyl-prolyl cis-trans isomerase C
MLLKPGAVAVHVSRSPFRGGRVLAVFLCLGLVALGPAVGQMTTPKSTPSPVEPGNLSKPVFDTTTPVYGSVASLNKAASTVVAEVEGRPITLGDVADAIKTLPSTVSQLPFDALYPGVLDGLIRQAALVVRAQQQGVDEEPAVHRRVKAAADRQLADEYLTREVSKGITEAALLDRYNRDIAGRPGEEEVRARIILVGTEKEAMDLIAEIKGGVDFATVARRASKDTTAPAGGDLDFHARGGMNQEVGAVAFSLAVGQVAAYPVRSAAGWFVVKTEERRQRPTPSFASVREQLRQSLLRDGVGAVTDAALKDMKIRRYSFTGAEVGAEKPETEPTVAR